MIYMKKKKWYIIHNLSQFPPMIKLVNPYFKRVLDNPLEPPSLIPLNHWAELDGLGSNVATLLFDKWKIDVKYGRICTIDLCPRIIISAYWWVNAGLKLEKWCMITVIQEPLV